MKRIAFTVDGETVRARLHEPPGTRRQPVPLVMLAHGLSSSSVEWYDFPQKIARGGYAVLALDFRGHGESDGERGVQSVARARADLAAALEAMRREYHIDLDRVALLGHSLGGALVLCAAPSLPVRCVIALAPVRRLRDELNPFEFVGYNLLRWVNAPLRLLYRPGLRVPYKVDYNNLYADPDAVERARRDAFLQPTIPIKNYRALVARLNSERCARKLRLPALVMVAEWDVLVGKYNSRRVYEALAGPKKFVEVPRSGHSMAGDASSDFVAAHCREFLDQHLQGIRP